jgi:flagellar hook protein FlgE
MGIYGALSTAVTGLRAQAFALENVSGNIANSQTTGFKRVDTDFMDLVSDAPLSRQSAGSVLSQSRSTNNVQGDIRSVTTATNMAINGNGFFVVEPPIGQADGNAVFAGANYYTRRGDFELDKGGYLVNGAGYVLKGLPIDPVTHNISGSVPQVLQIDSSFLPAAQTTRIDYRLNLPLLPKTAQYQDSQAPGSELLNASNFMPITPDVAAAATGATLVGTENAATVAAPGTSMTVTVDGVPVVFDFYDAFVGPYAGANVGIDVQTNTPVSIADMLAAIEAGLQASGVPAAADATVGLGGGGVLSVTLGTNITASFAVAGAPTGLGLANGTYNPSIAQATLLSARVDEISAQDSDEFIRQSILGGAITIYTENGAPLNVQMRWAKVNSTVNGGTDTWNLFMLVDGQAEGANTMWERVGDGVAADYTFGTNGAPTNATNYTSLEGMSVNGAVIGNVRLQHGENGITQFADPNGTAGVTALNQNGYAAGEFVSVAVNNNGRVVVSYNNGQQLEVAQVVTANFNAVNQLKRMDGGVFAATSESGEPILDNEGNISGASLESSNTDISEEFTKLIVTQQAYAAGTRIVSTANEMLQAALNMVR